MMKEQEFYKFNVKVLPYLIFPRKFEIYDSLTEKLEFSGRVRGSIYARYFLYDVKGVELIKAKKRCFFLDECNILKDGKVIASFRKYASTLVKKGYEIRTKTQTYRTPMIWKKFIFNFNDESGKDVFTLNRTFFGDTSIEVDQNFDIEIALIVSLILLFKTISEAKK